MGQSVAKLGCGIVSQTGRQNATASLRLQSPFLLPFQDIAKPESQARKDVGASNAATEETIRAR